MIEEIFATGDSPLHRCDPRSRVAFATLLSFVIAVSEQFPALWLGLAYSLILLLMARLHLREVMKRVLILWGVLIFLWIILPLTFEGESLYRIGKLNLSREGFLLCARISLKSNSILLIFIALVTTMNFSTLGYVLNFFRIPEKLVHLLLLTYRYIFVIEQEYHRLLRAARIRSFHPKSSLHTYKTYAYLVGMLFVRASARAERVYQAMKCRGFHGKFYCLQEFTFSRTDRIWTVSALTGIAVLIFMELVGNL